MNCQPNSELPPPSDVHCQGLQITLPVGRKPVGSSVGGLGAPSVYRILHENVGSLITSSILNRIPKFHHHWIPTVKGYKSHSGSATNRLVHRLVDLVHTRSTKFCMKTSARPYLHEFSTEFRISTTVGFPPSRATNHTPSRPTTGQFIGWWTWCTLGLPNFASKRRLTHTFMNSQPNSEFPPPLDSHRQGLQITLRVGQKPVGPTVGGLGAHSVYQILHENVGSLNSGPADN